MGVHGNVLPFFCDELRTFKYFNMMPEITTGFSNRIGVKKIKGILHMYSVPPSAEGTSVRQSHANSVIEKVPFLWTKYPLIIAWFIEDGLDIYRLTSLNEWLREGSMQVFGLEKVVGDDGTITNEPAYNFGGDSFG
jgi:hypothetical protein